MKRTLLVMNSEPGRYRGALRWYIRILHDLHAGGLAVAVLLRHPSLLESLRRECSADMPTLMLSDFPAIGSDDTLLIPDWEQTFLEESAHLFARRVLLATHGSETALSLSRVTDIPPDAAFCLSSALVPYVQAMGVSEVYQLARTLPEVSVDANPLGLRPVVLLEDAGLPPAEAVESWLRRQSSLETLLEAFDWVRCSRADAAQIGRASLLVLPDASSPSPEAAQALRAGCLTLAYHSGQPDSLLRIDREAGANAVLVPWGDLPALCGHLAKLLPVLLHASQEFENLRKSLRSDAARAYPVDAFARDWKSLLG